MIYEYAFYNEDIYFYYLCCKSVCHLSFKTLLKLSLFLLFFQEYNFFKKIEKFRLFLRPLVQCLVHCEGFRIKI